MTSNVKMLLKGVSFLILILTVEGEWKGKDCPVDEAIGNQNLKMDDHIHISETLQCRRPEEHTNINYLIQTTHLTLNISYKKTVT